MSSLFLSASTTTNTGDIHRTGGTDEMGMSRRTTDSWGTTESARAFFAASGAVLVAVLAGCSSGGSLLVNPAPALNSVVAETHAPANAPQRDTTDPTDSSESSSTRQNAPPAFHFESGDVVLGDFVYEDVKGNIFNPCEEISAEEFAAIGFETDGAVLNRRVEEINGCALYPSGSDSDGTVLVTGGSANLAEVSQQGAIAVADVSDIVPGAYTYSPKPEDTDLCFASVDTERGQISMATFARGTAHSFTDLCLGAIQHLENLYQLK